MSKGKRGIQQSKLSRAARKAAQCSAMQRKAGKGEGNDGSPSQSKGKVGRDEDKRR